MISRTNIVLLILAALQLGILFLVSRDDSESPTEAQGVTIGEAVYGEKDKRPAIDGKDVGAIRISGDEGAEIRLDRVAGKDGAEDTWMLASTEGFPVKESSVSTMVGALNRLRFGKVLTTRKGNLTNHKVADERHARHVVVNDKSGKPIADFYLGDTAGGGHAPFRKAGETAAFFVSGASPTDFETSASRWIDTKFSAIEKTEVASLQLEHDGKKIEIVREDRPKALPAEPKETEAPKEGDPPKDPPKPETETFWVLKSADGPKDCDKSKVESLISTLGSLQAAEPVGKTEKEDFGFAAPTATATVTLKDNAVRTITIGKKREKEGDFYAKRSGFDFIVTLRSWSVDDGFKKKVEDLLPKPPEEKKDPPGENHDGHGH